MFSKQTHNAEAARREAAAREEPSLDRRAEDLSAKRTELAAKLGALIYEQTKTDPQARRGHEVLYDGIAEIDRELENLKREREHLAQLATPAGHAFCPFCGKQVSAAAIFCPQCGTRLTVSDTPHRAATLTDQLEELDLEEPDFDGAALAEANAGIDGTQGGTGNAADNNPVATVAAETPDAQLAPTAGTSGVPAKTDGPDAAATGASAPNDAAPADEENGATADTAATEEGASATDVTAAITDDTAAIADHDTAGADWTDDADAADAAQADPASVLYSSRRDGIADALAPAADSVSAFHLAPEIIREAQADITPEDEFDPAPFADTEADTEATKLLPVVTVEDAAHDNAGFDPDSFGFDDSFSLDDEFDLKMAARERKNDDPDATQILPTAVVEASSFENDATEVLPGTVDDAPDFDESDATRIMTAIPDDGDHYEPDPQQRTYRSF